MSASIPTVCFSHGQESGPWGTKIQALAQVARAAEFPVESLDYRGEDPDARVRRLSDWCAAQSEPPILVGSSLGAYVALCAAARVPAAGLFLLAPAVYLPGDVLPTPPAPSVPLAIAHGWRDDVVPVDSAIRYARDAGATLHIFDGDHRLIGNLDDLCFLFGHFLRRFRTDSASGGGRRAAFVPS